ncbi:helix-turn-helix domain-containing protein [Pseudonocardia sp. WMMC193]|uniref:helix-turn-helix domain-containing protein n=1 Tax=Pseudonocardia sp. WMMC193 TaxID=2911965 RepID=UPI001F29AE4C|nr:helix-turn-helix domain-containing protein [Pseudonocardia sp. WMMC193]MCF7552605.1 helix-turn-helix domain-containing protein [Pseudonocardia sp. WMMC193]
MNSNAEQRRNLRESIRADVLKKALAKRAAGVPTYSIPEAAALLSISQEYLYRVVNGGDFPAAHISTGASKGRFVIAARAVEKYLAEAAEGTGCVESADFAARWRAENGGLAS